MRRDRKVLPPEGGKLFAIVSKHSGFPVFSTFAHNRIACVRNELIAITSQGNKMSLDNVSLTKVVTLLLNEVIKLRRQRDETT